MNRREFLCCMGGAGVATLAGCTAPGPSGKKGGEALSDKATVRPESFSYCGVDCNVCDVFKATVQGDAEALQRAHKLWTKTAQQHWGMQTLDPAILRCRGCRTNGAEIFKGCRLCPVRRCAKGKNLASCGLCPEWKECERLSSLLADERQARHNLEQIEAGSTQ